MGRFLTTVCSHPPREGRSCIQGLVSACPHSCLYTVFLLTGVPWVGLWDLHASGSNSATFLVLLRLYPQPLLHVSVRPGFSKDPWMPSHLLLETDVCFPAAWRPRIEAQRCPTTCPGRSALPSSWTQAPGGNPASPSGLGSDPLARKVGNKTEVGEIWKNKFFKP